MDGLTHKSPCRHCGGDNRFNYDTNEPSEHRYWCRENIPLAVRERAYFAAMVGNGHLPSRVAEWIAEGRNK